MRKGLLLVAMTISSAWPLAGCAERSSAPAVEAEGGRQDAKEGASIAIETTREACGEAKAEVERFPTADALRRAIEENLAAAETALAEAESALEADEVAKAKEKAEAAGVWVAKAQSKLNGAKRASEGKGH